MKAKRVTSFFRGLIMVLFVGCQSVPVFSSPPNRHLSLYDSKVLVNVTRFNNPVAPGAALRQVVIRSTGEVLDIEAVDNDTLSDIVFPKGNAPIDAREAFVRVCPIMEKEFNRGSRNITRSETFFVKALLIASVITYDPSSRGLGNELRLHLVHRGLWYANYTKAEREALQDELEAIEKSGRFFVPTPFYTCIRSIASVGQSSMFVAEEYYLPLAKQAPKSTIVTANNP